MWRYCRRVIVSAKGLELKKVLSALLAIVFLLGIAAGVWWLTRDDQSPQIRILREGAVRNNALPAAGEPHALESPTLEPTVAVAADVQGPSIPVGHAVQSIFVPEGTPPATEDDSHFMLGVAVDHGGRIWPARMSGRLGCYGAADRSHEFAPPIPGNQDPITAMAVDRHGRVWAGHAFNGVSVYDGQRWQSYGLLDGPLGEHVTKIAVNAVNGDVWLATNRGLTRYSEAGGWSYFTRQSGLLSDDFVSVALSPEGDVYAATADSGLAIGRMADNCATWTNVRALGDNRAQADGHGLSSDWCTDVFVAKDRSVYVSTVAGLSFSRDAGKTWAFVRGNPWLNRARNATRPPKLPDKPPTGYFNYDAISCVGEDAAGNVLIGHPFDRGERLDPKTLRSIETLPENTGQATQIVRHGPYVYIATNRFGIVTDRGRPVAGDTPPPARAPGTSFAFEKSAVDAGLPAPAAPPDAAALSRLTAALPTRPTVVAGTLGTDWVTGGDCTGRYGWDFTTFMPMRDYPAPPGMAFDVDLGPHQNPHYGCYHFFANRRPSADPRCLYFMRQGRRRMGEWNDGTWNPGFVDTWEGPDLWLRFSTAAAANRVAVYLINEDGGNNADITRDHPIELKADTGDLNSTDTGLTLATSRARMHMRGMYASFIVGPGKWVLKINRNYGNSTKANGLFIDELTPRFDGRPNLPVGDLAGVDFRPKWDGTLKDDAPVAKAAAALWAALDKDRIRFATVDWPDRILAYRAMQNASTDETLKAAWRWQLPLWTDADRKTWSAGVQEAAKRRNLIGTETDTGTSTKRPVS